MIVQCDKCSAKFRLDDSKVKAGGVKVRCSKCSSIFVVQHEAPAEESDYDSFLSGLMPTPQATKPDIEGVAPDTTSGSEPAGSDPGLLTDTEQPTEKGEDRSEGVADQDDFDLSEFAFDDQTLGQTTFEPSPDDKDSAAGGSFVFGELDMGSAAHTEIQPEIMEREAAGTSHNEFAFNDEPARPLPDFEVTIDGMDMFGSTGEINAGSEPAAPHTEDKPVGAEPVGFPFELETVDQNIPESGRNSFSEKSAEFLFEPDATGPEQPVFTAAEEKGVEPPPAFDFSQFEFGDESVAEPAESGHTHVGNLVSAPQVEPDSHQILAGALATHDQEEDLPPLSISSRRKEGSSLPISVTAFCILLVLLLAGGGFFFFEEGPAAFNKLGLGFMANWFGSEGREEGGIAVRNTTGMFLINKESGEIFAITGEAVNNFGKPRASIQVKVTLYGPKGVVLAQKTAYCGNPLSRDQLVTLPLAKIEAAMNNQFGDSLSNLSVLPGKGIPFAVVLTNVPKETAEFGVDVLGSTVASQ
jgi:predicted Zn finger-like uncharacterized protein